MLFFKLGEIFSDLVDLKRKRWQAEQANQELCYATTIDMSCSFARNFSLSSSLLLFPILINSCFGGVHINLSNDIVDYL